MQDEHENIMENKNCNKLQNMMEKTEKKRSLSLQKNADLDRAMQQN